MFRNSQIGVFFFCDLLLHPPGSLPGFKLATANLPAAKCFVLEVSFSAVLSGKQSNIWWFLTSHLTLWPVE